ncbi:hypothetical protein FKP32DRAFT_369276 [Trametes sanguinea]|nr:hypothetical protein FKP32DRAFT_369276 [Trametes sanguinea]
MRGAALPISGNLRSALVLSAQAPENAGTSWISSPCFAVSIIYVWYLYTINALKGGFEPAWQPHPAQSPSESRATVRASRHAVHSTPPTVHVAPPILRSHERGTSSLRTLCAANLAHRSRDQRKLQTHIRDTAQAPRAWYSYSGGLQRVLHYATIMIRLRQSIASPAQCQPLTDTRDAASDSWRRIGAR